MHHVVEVATRATLAADVQTSRLEQRQQQQLQRLRHYRKGREEAEKAAEEEAEREVAPLRHSKELAALLLQAAEEKVGAARFIGVFGEIQRNLQRGKANKKRERAAEAVTDPQAFALKKVSHEVLDKMKCHKLVHFDRWNVQL